MKVILLEKIRNLGQLGEMVNVKPGYARNYLIPKSKAATATKENINMFESKRSELEAKAQEQFSEAQAKAERLEGISLTIMARASEEGKLYGSVGTNEIKKAIQEEVNVNIERKDIRLPTGPIHTLGETEVGIQLHSDIVKTIKVVVVEAKEK